jgi:hypothetical protein
MRHVALTASAVLAALVASSTAFAAQAGHADPVAPLALALALVLVSRDIFSAVVVMVILTTLMTPIALKHSLGRHKAGTPPAPQASDP